MQLEKFERAFLLLHILGFEYFEEQIYVTGGHDSCA